MESYGLRTSAFGLTVGAPILTPREPRSLADACREFYNIASAVYVASGHEKIVFSFSFCGSTVRLDLSEAKAATVICAIGIGVGLGTYLLYKIYCKFVQPSSSNRKAKKKHKKHLKRNNVSSSSSGEQSDCSEDEMGNSSSSETVPVRYSPVSGVQIGRKGRSDNHYHKVPLVIGKTRQRKQRRGSARRSSNTFETTESPSNWNGISVISNGISSSVNGIDIKSGGTDRLIHSSSDLDSSSLCGSLKGNLSLKSLYDRNFRYGFDDNFQIISKSLKSPSSEENLRVEISSGQDVPSISSVLLTPPSDEDALSNSSTYISPKHTCYTKSKQQQCEISHISNNALFDSHIANGYLESSFGNGEQLFKTYSKDQCPKNLLHDSGITDQSIILSQNTDSSTSSPLHSSNSSKLFSNYTTDVSGNLSLDDDQDNSSPLHRVKQPDGLFRNSLLHRLHEYATVGGSSTSTSLNSTPEVSPYHRKRAISLDADDFSGRGTPEPELFSSGAALGEITTECFETLEHEVHDIGDEFDDICAKLNELKQLAARSSGSEELDSDYTPSDPLAKKACDLVERTRERIIRSRSMSLSEDSTSPRNGSFRDTDGVELAWDSEHMTEEQSEKIKNIHAKNIESQEPELEDKFLDASENSVDGISNDIVQHLCNDQDSIQSCDKLRISDWSMSLDEGSESVSVTTCFLCGKIRIRVQDLDLSDFPADVCRCVYRRSDDTDLDVDTEFESGGEDPGKTDHASMSISTNTGPLPIGKSFDVLQYAEQEWKGQTDKARCIRKAYHEVPKMLCCHHLRQIRGDNYCAIRGTVFQCLINNVDITRAWVSPDTVMENINKHLSDTNSGLSSWNFAGRLPTNKNDILSSMSGCIHVLFSKFQEAKSLSTYKYRLDWAIQTLNTDSECDLQLMEATKLLMYLTALRLYERNLAGKDVPVFVWLMFARDSSSNPHHFVCNHLNCVGDSAGLEQVEMCLLGYALEVRLQVLRLAQYGQEDFLTSFPEEAETEWPTISLLAEDDRHYNVPMSSAD